MGERVVSFKIWKSGGLIVHAADPALIGQRFGVPDNLRRALAGEVIADFDDLHDEEDAGERASGLAAPELQGLSVERVIEAAVEGHRHRTRSAVDMSVDVPDLLLDHPERICIYRFVQEALSNAFRHAEGSGQSVHAEVDSGKLHVAVTDDGPGFAEEVLAGLGEGLGLRGLKERVGSLGGSLTVENMASGGARLQMTLLLREDQE